MKDLNYKIAEYISDCKGAISPLYSLAECEKQSLGLFGNKTMKIYEKRFLKVDFETMCKFKGLDPVKSQNPPRRIYARRVMDNMNTPINLEVVREKFKSLNPKLEFDNETSSSPKLTAWYVNEYFGRKATKVVKGAVVMLNTKHYVFKRIY